MIRVDEMIEKDYGNKKDAVKMLVTVHDEIVLEVKNNLVKEVAKKVEKIMEGVIRLKVPVVVEAKYGDNWGEMETVDS
jgi:DNA polymerase-1